MDFDDIFQEFGTYQKMIIYLVLLPAVIPCGFHAYNQIFMSAKPDHWCKIPELEIQNLSVGIIKNLSIPFKSVASYKGCVYYERNDTVGDDTFELVPCRHGWRYDDSKYTSTVVTEPRSGIPPRYEHKRGEEMTPRSQRSQVSRRETPSIKKPIVIRSPRSFAKTPLKSGVRGRPTPMKILLEAGGTPHIGLRRSPRILARAINTPVRLKD